MDLGITLPTSGPHASPQSIVWMAQEAERLGYASIWTYERLLYPLGDISQPGGPARPLPEHYKMTYEPIETLAYVASKTKSIKLGISVIGAPFHVPVVLARRLATLDQFSNGRVIAGLGQGWIEQEFVTANVSLQRRGNGVEEFIAAVRAAWSPDPVNFEGRFYHIPESHINPKPIQQGGIPILMGVFAPAAIERAARIADGLNPIAISFDALQGMVNHFRDAAHCAGRDPTKLKIMVRANVPITDTSMMDRRPFLGGSPEQIADDLQRARDLNVDQVFFTNMNQPPLVEQIRLLERLQRAAT
jgi:probable F420-dependent oxidoreductase